MATLQSVLDKAARYMTRENLELLGKAHEYAGEVYADRPDRLSGEPYLSHPLAVAEILAGMSLDVHTVISGLLHKALWGTPPRSSDDELEDLFGRDVALIVRGATKLDTLQFSSRLDYKAENVKKMLLAISSDIRVLLVKLADHLHDMQTLEYVPRSRQIELATDSKDLYAPLASRLGIDWIKRELEDLFFRYLYPKEFAELTSKIEMSQKEREEFVEEIKSILDASLQQHGLRDYRILGRPKHLYSIYRKLVAQNISIDKVYDKVAFRVIVQEVGECYEVMGIVHALWQPVPSRFKDFISSPKANLYQSLHTSVVGPHGDFMEIQIRTEKMDEIANDGIAAHWAYKEGTEISSKDARLFQWLKQLVQSLQGYDDSREFLDAVAFELDHSEVYAMTPNGDVIELPFGSTPLDFAYTIHTEVGHHCTGAKINGKIVPLKYEIQNGDVVEIITSPHQFPNQGWLSIVKTSRAKNRIRHWLKQEEQARFLKEGKEICERELRKHQLSLKRLVKTGHIQEILRRLNCNSLEELLIKVGGGKVTIEQLEEEFEPPEIKAEKARRREEARRQELEKAARKSAGRSRRRGRRSLVRIDGIDDMLVKISSCCMPVPGDPIAGFITAGRGVSVHKTNCVNFLASDPSRHVEVEWAVDGDVAHKARIQVTARDNKGLLINVCDIINREDADIIDVEAHAIKKKRQARIEVVLEVTDSKHLDAILEKLRRMDGVLGVGRM